MKLLILVVSAIVLAHANPVSLPFPEKCKADDTKCLKEAAEKAIPIVAEGLPQFEVFKLDPLYVKKIDASSNTLKLVLKDTNIVGLKTCKPKKIQFDTVNNKISLKLLCDVVIDGDYVMKGSLLVLPIEGKGKVHAELNKLSITVDLDMLEEIKDNKKYLKVKSWTHSFDLKARSKLNFENLFNGNELLGRAARELISSSGNEIILEIGPPAVKAVANKIVDSVRNLFEHVPLEEMFL